MRPEGLGKLKKKNHFIRSRTREPPTFSKMPKPICYHYHYHYRKTNIFLNIFILNSRDTDRLCGIVVRVPGYKSRGPDSIPRATRFSEQ
jgi:hypothetical protein